MSPRTVRRVHAIGEALRTLTGGVLLAGGFLALLWLCAASKASMSSTR